MPHQFFPLGETAVTVQFGDRITEEQHRNILDISAYIDEFPPKWMVEYVPAFTSITFYYDPLLIFAEREEAGYFETAYETVCHWIDELISGMQGSRNKEPRMIEIPVCYGGEFGPGLDFVAKHNKLTTDEVIHYHAGGDYTVYMIGFAPGFPYIGGLNEKIAAPRLDTPSRAVPAGSVGIAGKQTGIYSIQTPGGWRIIGQTPLKLFRPQSNPPSLLRAGDRLRFKPISKEEFFHIKETAE
ncbi:5-oxoprolinase subunit PxpB [Mesobacillus zeae]|uniref:5-oxoprolinase subunit PxpB n=1 Tax=Mesobacillus zeae TaxID=1917180 RepID=A0A398AY67_9BACI|nr:5-oxoprolinase subunit PxpB [Mesobacillus zeae]RID82481.1 5-oxoprolinase subunit PxpB [Mesobacillus zeae]